MADNPIFSRFSIRFCPFCGQWTRPRLFQVCHVRGGELSSVLFIQLHSTGTQVATPPSPISAPRSCSDNILGLLQLFYGSTAVPTAAPHEPSTAPAPPLRFHDPLRCVSDAEATLRLSCSGVDGHTYWYFYDASFTIAFKKVSFGCAFPCTLR
eukprot:NODE_950_length_647_cov_189.891304_g879_i0.p1 GENE.NODE_950_length_647_cov_189.891304_g879_i0~~NODE_950_length_647_cov_189.891304_g879_i0.p1  ORF type:complete len:153 (+),score=23.46 NODE_950_length_647_cov_189.891304_g879_i0:185-643(+)